MDAVRPSPVPSDAIKATNKPSAKTQPWRAFITDPEVRPFPAEDVGENGILRLKTEKDEHGLGG